MTPAMSKTSTPYVDGDEPPAEDPLDAVEENRELLERIANSDVPLSGVCQRALDELDNPGERDD